MTPFLFSTLRIRATSARMYQPLVFVPPVRRGAHLYERPPVMSADPLYLHPPPCDMTALLCSPCHGIPVTMSHAPLRRLPWMSRPTVLPSPPVARPSVLGSATG